MTNRVIFFLVIFFIYFNSNSQIINAYAEVTNIAGNVLTLGNVDEAAHSFEDTEYIIIMQMQDNSIGDITNTANFGDLGDIYESGLYEVRQINSHTETAGVPSSITLENNPNYSYNICANCNVQIISFRSYGGPNYTTTGNMSAKSWDGTTGGVLAFFVPGTLTLLHNLDADQDGFRGAGPNAGGSTGCSGGSNYRVNTQDNFADKGEGIYRNTTTNYNAGMAKILNGGGGGNSHNGGGGGGGNFTSGGDAGPGWPTCSPSAGGLGGISLQSVITVGRVFMGGGGGAGEGNNNLSTDGGIGGGIILIKADEIVTNACTGVSISANGESISFAGNDGGGGGGAAGSIVLEVNSWNISGGCPLVVEANGGNGGDVNSGATHGGGGGGGQGVIYYSTATPSGNVSSTTNNGQGGCDNDSSPCNSQAGNGGGSDGDGVVGLSSLPLPISLTNFEAQLINDHALISWETQSESNNDFFTIEKSLDGHNWISIEQINGAGNSTISNQYFSRDYQIKPGTTYYRLRQTDYNGTYSHSSIQQIHYDENHTLIYPNPANNILSINKINVKEYNISVYNMLGQKIEIQLEIDNTNLAHLNVKDLPSGIYYVVMEKGLDIESHKVNINN